MIKVENGCFAYPKGPQILDQISFELNDGEIMTVLGQNGIGKTTLIKCLAGILRWTDGETLVDGKKIEKVKDIKGFGYVPQAHPMSFAYTVKQIVLMGRASEIGMFSVPSAKDRELADEAMEEVGIADLSERCCSQLSGGQLQLVFIARALASNPRFMILDEPESHLDFKNQFLVLRLIERLAREKGISCVINTHFPEHALVISDKTLLLGKKRFCFGDTVDMVSEKRIAEFFQIRSKIISIHDGLKEHKAFIVLDTL
jgi:iron complex transport system ATP-binding protein